MSRPKRTGRGRRRIGRRRSTRAGWRATVRMPADLSEDRVKVTLNAAGRAALRAGRRRIIALATGGDRTGGRSAVTRSYTVERRAP